VIIACDDNAQEYFAKEITDIPVVFCGVNLEPSTKYAYPRKNVVGVRETLFTKELINMIKNFFPEIANIVFMGDRSETTSGIVEQLEEAEYEGITKNILILDTYSNWKETVKSFDGYNTAVVLLINRELKNENGEAVDSAEVTRWTVNNSTFPVFAIMNYAIEEGAVGGVVNTGYGEGKQAGEIVKEFLSGTSLMDIGLEKSKNSYVMLNVASALSAGVSFDSEWFERVDKVVTNREMSADTVLNLFLGSFEERVHGIMTSLKILSETPEVKSGEWTTMKPLLSAFNENYEGLVIYVLPDGGYYSVQRNWTRLNLSNRGYFPILKNGGNVKGYQVMSRSTGKRSVVFGVPVWREEKITGFVGLSAFFEDWNSELISEFKEIENLHFYAFDAQNTLALTDNTALLLGSLDVDVPGLSDRIDSLDSESGSFLFVANDTLNVQNIINRVKLGGLLLLPTSMKLKRKIGKCKCC
jgi:ABC-type uncharacterized transport system substrate-binding protein